MSMNLIRESIPRARTLINNRSAPTITAPKNPFSQPQNFVAAPIFYSYPSAVMIPYGTPFVYSGASYYQPVTYPQFQTPFVPTFPLPTGSSKRTSLADSSFAPSQTEEITNSLDDLDASDKKEKLLDVHMDVDQLYSNIKLHFEMNPSCRISWMNRMLAKCNTPSQFEKALDIFRLFQHRGIQTTPETGTLLIKAACRAGIPERALTLLANEENEISLWPTLGGIHYLMISFSLKKDTKRVMQTYEFTKTQKIRPTTRTYHILIRECVDNDLIDDAMRFSEESKINRIVPNRVTFNILMNGCRKFQKAKEILSLRKQMNEHKIDINDTTVKFTALAYMMLNDIDAAVKEFLDYPELNTKMEEFSLKFFEVMEESLTQKKCVIGLFAALKSRGTRLPPSIEHKLMQLESSLK